MTICRGVWLVSGGVWMVYGWNLGVAWTFWIMSSVYWCQINWEKSTRYRFNEVSQFLPVVHFRLKQAHRPKFSTGGGRIFFGVNAQFFGSEGQVMDVGTQWGWWRRKILTGPIYPPTLSKGSSVLNTQFSCCAVSRLLYIYSERSSGHFHLNIFRL